VTGVAAAFLAAVLGVSGVSQLLGSLPRRRGGVPLIRGLAAMGSGFSALPAPGDLAARLDAAGRPGGLGEREVMTAKLATALVTALFGALVAAAAPGRLGPVILVLAPATGFLLPDLWLARLARERRRAALRELPALLDLLRVTVESGASLPEALRSVGEQAGGPLALEWRTAGRRVALGVPLSAALDEMGRRLPVPALAAFIAAMDRSLRHGAPLARTLAAQSRDARAALSRDAREHAARAGPKIQLVVALLLVPSVLLLVAAALVSALAGSGGELLPV